MFGEEREAVVGLQGFCGSEKVNACLSIKRKGFVVQPAF
jgi:hypothetical protein